jgi:tRNA (guanine-N7-)-methyltransferase
MSDTEQPRFYGRRRGPKLRPGQQALLDEWLPQLAIPVPAAGATLDPASLFDPPRAAVWLEIGFGAGEHLVWQAAHHPEIGLIGCEPYLNGVAKCLVRMREAGTGNVRLYADDVRHLLPALPAASLARIFVLFPDPWPKRRHHRRRIVNPRTLAEFARLLADGGELRLASDHMEYVRWMLFHTRAQGDFEWLARRAADWRTRPDDWPQTRYERKAARGGARSVYLRFRRRMRENT